MEQHEPQTLLKVGEVARELRVSPFTVYRRIEAGDLSAIRLGENGPLRIPRSSLDEFLIPAAAERSQACSGANSAGS